jgi:hypothetical protein
MSLINRFRGDGVVGVAEVFDEVFVITIPEFGFKKHTGTFTTLNPKNQNLSFSSFSGKHRQNPFLFLGPKITFQISCFGMLF